MIVMEDPEAPHHMLLLRNFMSQGLVHNQALLYASPAKDPKGFLGTLPSPVSSRTEKSPNHESVEVPKSAFSFSNDFHCLLTGSNYVPDQFHCHHCVGGQRVEDCMAI